MEKERRDGAVSVLSRVAMGAGFAKLTLYSHSSLTFL